MANEKILKAMKSAFSMTKQRCYNENCRDYAYYGLAGIKICDRWLQSFDNFVADMGLRPEGMTLERKDVNADYSPENCMWATREVQSRNKKLTLKLTYKGETKTLPEWEKITGIPYGTLKARKNRLGYTDEQCLEKPVICGGKLEGRVYKERVYNPSRGYEHERTKFKKEVVETIREEYASGCSIKELSDKYKTAWPTIKKVVSKRSPYND
jgi:hypothetical protein